jgi:hypothetical protein
LHDPQLLLGTKLCSACGFLLHPQDSLQLALPVKFFLNVHQSIIEQVTVFLIRSKDDSSTLLELLISLSFGPRQFPFKKKHQHKI